MNPKYKHDCEYCKLFCVDTQGDWYVCESPPGSGRRSILRRYSDEISDYASAGVAECVTMTCLELAALARGFIFTTKEMRKTLAHLCDEKLGKLAIDDYAVILGEQDEPAWRVTASEL